MDSSGAVLLFTVICNTLFKKKKKKKLLDFLRSHGSLVTTETNKIQTRPCLVSEMPEDHT